jgi:hypothetical protein
MVKLSLRKAALRQTQGCALKQEAQLCGMVWAFRLTRALRPRFKQHHIAVFNDIFFAFIAGFAGFLGGYFAAE